MWHNEFTYTYNTYFEVDFKITVHFSPISPTNMSKDKSVSWVVKMCWTILNLVAMKIWPCKKVWKLNYFLIFGLVRALCLYVLEAGGRTEAGRRGGLAQGHARRLRGHAGSGLPCTGWDWEEVHWEANFDRRSGATQAETSPRRSSAAEETSHGKYVFRL